MSKSLREMCEEAAANILHPVDLHVANSYPAFVRVTADAIERTAKAFGAECVRDAMADWSLFRYEQMSGFDVDDEVVRVVAQAAATFLGGE